MGRSYDWTRTISGEGDHVRSKINANRLRRGRYDDAASDGALTDAMSFLSYAQNFEDVLLWRALGHVEAGVYIDIGGQDPVIDSVSKAFSLRGWKGVHVEASPYYADALRRDRPQDTVIEAAVGTSTQPITLYFIPGTGLSTGVESIAREHRANGYDVQPIQVRTVTLSSILNEFEADAVHWLKIDVEGMEADVLSSWGDSKVRPWVLVIESTYPNTQRPTHDQWIDTVSSLGYSQVYFDGLSRYFVSETHPEIAEAFSVPPNIFDSFSVTKHHFSTQEIAREHQGRLTEIEHAAHEMELSRRRSDDVAAALSRDKDALQQELQSAHVEIDARRARQEAADQRIERLSRDLTDSNALWLTRVNDMAVQIARLQTEEEASRQKVALLDGAVAAQRQRFDDALSDFQQKIALLSAEKERAIVILEERTLFWKERLEDMRGRLAAADDLNATLDRRLGTARDDLSRLEREGARRTADLQMQLDRLEHTLAAAQAADIALQRRLTDAQEAHREETGRHLRAIEERDAQLAAARVRVQEGVAALADRDHALAERNDSLAHVIAERDALNRQVQDYYHSSVADRAALDEAHARHERLSQEQADLERRLAALSGRMAQAREWHHRLQAVIERDAGSGIWHDLRARFAGTKSSEAKRISSEIAGRLSDEQPAAGCDEELERKGQPLIVDQPDYDHVDARSAVDILRHRGAAFVDVAFQSLLGRAPDDNGRTYYLRRLEDGWSRTSVLIQIARSDEGQAGVASVSGLDALLKRQRKIDFPLFGRFRHRTDEQRNAPLDRAMRRIEYFSEQNSDAISYVVKELKSQALEISNIRIATERNHDSLLDIEKYNGDNSSSISFGNNILLELNYKIGLLSESHEALHSTLKDRDAPDEASHDRIPGRLTVEDIIRIAG